jgi:hypothetical protein
MRKPTLLSTAALQVFLLVAAPVVAEAQSELPATPPTKTGTTNTTTTKPSKTTGGSTTKTTSTTKNKGGTASGGKGTASSGGTPKPTAENRTNQPHSGRR